MPPRRFSKTETAFSLVEVVLAIAVFTFAFVAILALMPVGLSTARNAVRTSEEMQISDQILNSLEATPFQNLANFTNQYSPDGTSTNASQSVYFVSVQIVPTVNLPSTVSPTSATTTTNLVSVQMTFTTLDHATNRYAATIANIGNVNQ